MITWFRFRGFFAVIIGLTFLSETRADNLDAALYEQAPNLLQFLKNRQYKNIGVLKFRAQKGNQPLSFRVGPINTNLAGRLENALVLKTDKANPIGIIHDASHVAQEHHLPTYSTDAGMEKLFQTRFPLAWESPAVFADAFVTGTVRASADMKKVTVTIQSFEKKSTKLNEITSFTVEMDRPLLNDLGQGFSLNSRSVKDKKSRALDLEAAEDAAIRDEAPPSPGSTQPSAEKLIDFQIRYDGKVQPYAPDPNNSGEMMVAEPQKGQRVSFFIRGLAPERIGVVLMVNGKNSLYEQELEPSKCAMWLPGRGEEVEVKGFQIDQKTIKPFRVLSLAESEAMTYSDNLGLIGVYIFRSNKDKPPEIVTPGGNTDLTVSGSRNLSLRSLPSQAGKSRSLAELQKQLASQITTSKKSRGLIGSDQKLEESRIEYFEISNPEQQQALVIRYFKPKGR